MPEPLPKLWLKKHQDRITSVIRGICVFIVVLVPVSTVVFFADRWHKPFYNPTPLPDYLHFRRIFEITGFFGAILFVFAFFVLVFLSYRRFSSPYRAIIVSSGVIIGVMLFYSFTSFIVSQLEAILDSTHISQSHFYVTVSGDPKMFDNYYFYKCNSSDLECEQTWIEQGKTFLKPAKLAANSDQQGIDVFIGHNLVYTYGPFPREYKSIGYAFVDTKIYYLCSYKENLSRLFVITRCDHTRSFEENESCEVIPFRYSTQSYKKAELAEVQSEKEVLLFIDGQLIFSYDTAPHCYAEGCEIN